MPRVGDIVWYWVGEKSNLDRHVDRTPSTPLAAIVAAVWPDGPFVSVCVIDAIGRTDARTRVPYKMNGEHIPEDGSSYCTAQGLLAKAAH